MRACDASDRTWKVRDLKVPMPDVLPGITADVGLRAVFFRSWMEDFR